MKFKIVEAYYYGDDIERQPYDYLDISVDEIIYYPRETRFCSIKAAEKFISKPRRDGLLMSMLEETNRTRKTNDGRIYRVVLDKKG
jgi:hypothetical protein